METTVTSVIWPAAGHGGVAVESRAADVYFDRQREVLTRRDKVKRRTSANPWNEFVENKTAWTANVDTLLARMVFSPKQSDDPQLGNLHCCA